MAEDSSSIKESTENDPPKSKSNGTSSPKEKQSQSRSQIPRAVFVEDVDKFMQDPKNSTAEVVLKRFDEQHTKYKFLEANLLEKRKRLRYRIPDLQKSLNMIDFLKAKKSKDEHSITQYLLSSGVYGYADIPPTEKVCLWLGANVMLEYPIEEATELLGSNHKTAMKSLQQLEEELEFVSDQCTTLEVAMTRVYNWDVKERREKKQLQLT